MKLPKRKRDVRIVISRTVFTELAPRYHLKKNTVLDGWLDKQGNFRQKKDGLVVYPSHFKVMGKFYFRKARA